MVDLNPNVNTATQKQTANTNTEKTQLVQQLRNELVRVAKEQEMLQIKMANAHAANKDGDTLTLTKKEQPETNCIEDLVESFKATKEGRPIDALRLSGSSIIKAFNTGLNGVIDGWKYGLGIDQNDQDSASKPVVDPQQLEMQKKLEALQMEDKKLEEELRKAEKANQKILNPPLIEKTFT